MEELKNNKIRFLRLNKLKDIVSYQVFNVGYLFEDFRDFDFELTFIIENDRIESKQ